MRARFYVSVERMGMLKLTADLGKPGLLVELSDKNLNWNSISLNKEQVAKLTKFLNDTPME